jgi:hypothetical protein
MRLKTKLAAGAASVALLDALGVATAAAATVSSAPAPPAASSNTIQDGPHDGPDTPGEAEDPATGADTDTIQK